MFICSRSSTTTTTTINSHSFNTISNVVAYFSTNNLFQWPAKSFSTMKAVAHFSTFSYHFWLSFSFRPQSTIGPAKRKMVSKLDFHFFFVFRGLKNCIFCASHHHHHHVIVKTSTRAHFIDHEHNLKNKKCLFHRSRKVQR